MHRACAAMAALRAPEVHHTLSHILRWYRLIQEGLIAGSRARPHMRRRRIIQHAAEVLPGGAHADKVASIEARIQSDRALGAHARRVRPTAGCAHARFLFVQGMLLV